MARAEQNRARLEAGARPGRMPVVPEHMVPLALFLASQDATGVSGQRFDVLTWNREHGLGDQERWQDRSFAYEVLVSA